jgi:hypothetical protein
MSRYLENQIHPRDSGAQSFIFITTEKNMTPNLDITKICVCMYEYKKHDLDGYIFLYNY